MLSMPPAMTTSLVPARIESWPSIIAFMPDPHILLTVSAPTSSGTPAYFAACRAGA